MRARLDQAWASFSGFVAGLPDAEVAPLLAHLARWHNSCTERLTELAAGRAVPPIDADQMNAVWMEEDRDLGLEEARRRCEESLTGLREAIAAVPAGVWTERMVGQVEVDAWRHYDEHREWLSGA